MGETEPSYEVSFVNHVSSTLRTGEQKSSWFREEAQPCSRDCLKKNVPSKMRNGKLPQGNTTSLRAVTSSASWSKVIHTVKYLEPMCKCSGLANLYLDTHVSNLGHALAK